MADDDRQSDDAVSGRAKSHANLTGGSRKGVPNKTTRLVKQAISDAFDELGGTEGLVTWARANEDNLKVFYSSILPKLIPVQTELTGADGAPLPAIEVRLIAPTRTGGGLTSGDDT